MKKYVNYFFIILFTLFANHWVIGPKNSFVFDDWAYLYKFKFQPLTNFFKLLPDSTYNDRPIGEIFLKILYNLFGDNYQLYHLVLLLLHTVNAILLYQIIIIVAKQKFPKLKHPTELALVCAIIFSIWPKSLMAVQWNAAIFDLLGTFVALIIFRIYPTRFSSQFAKIGKSIVILALFFISLRTKEMFVVLPAILAMYELFNTRGVRRSVKKILNVVIIGQILISLGYIAMLIFLKSNNHIVNDQTSPYFLSTNPLVIAENFFRYVFLYFNYSSVEFSFVQYNILGVITSIVFLTIITIGLFKSKKYFFDLTLIFLLLPISLLTVLPLKNIQHNLYLYFPSIFFSLIISVFFYFLIEKTLKNPLWQKTVSILVLIIVTALTTYSKSITIYRNFWFSVANNNQQTYQSIRAISPPASNSSIYVLNVNDAINSFIQGHGAVFWFSYNDPSLKMILNPETVDRTQNNYLILQYDNGNVTEIERK